MLGTPARLLIAIRTAVVTGPRRGILAEVEGGEHAEGRHEQRHDERHRHRAPDRGEHAAGAVGLARVVGEELPPARHIDAELARGAKADWAARPARCRRAAASASHRPTVSNSSGPAGVLVAEPGRLRVERPPTVPAPARRRPLRSRRLGMRPAAGRGPDVRCRPARPPAARLAAAAGARPGRAGRSAGACRTAAAPPGCMRSNSRQAVVRAPRPRSRRRARAAAESRGTGRPRAARPPSPTRAASRSAIAASSNQSKWLPVTSKLAVRSSVRRKAARRRLVATAVSRARHLAEGPPAVASVTSSSGTGQNVAAPRTR